ncbi:hypothetical protein B7L09_03155 [Pseudomonas mandelii]|nr:hypothetical protein B7L09_03155 [Pseudomonas mandelii]
MCIIGTGIDALTAGRPDIMRNGYNKDLMKFTLLVRGREDFLVDRYSERKESAEELSKRVNQRSI